MLLDISSAEHWRSTCTTRKKDMWSRFPSTASTAGSLVANVLAWGAPFCCCCRQRRRAIVTSLHSRLLAVAPPWDSSFEQSLWRRPLPKCLNNARLAAGSFFEPVADSRKEGRRNRSNDDDDDNDDGAGWGERIMQNGGGRRKRSLLVRRTSLIFCYLFTLTDSL